jgi:hypothetical protein
LSYYHNTHCPSYCVPEYRSCHRIPGRYGHLIWNSCRLRGHTLANSTIQQAAIYVFCLRTWYFLLHCVRSADIVCSKSIDEFQKLGPVEVTSCPVLHFTLPCKKKTAPIRSSFTCCPLLAFCLLCPYRFLMLFNPGYGGSSSVEKLSAAKQSNPSSQPRSW